MKYPKHLLLPLFFCVYATHAAAHQDTDVLRYPPNTPQFSALNITVINPSLRPLSEPLPGRIAYDEERISRVDASVAGRVTRIGAKPGDAVYRGQTLLELDMPELGAALDDVAKADAELAQYRAAYERARMLFERQMIPHAHLGGFQSELHSAKIHRHSELQSIARRNLDQALMDLAKAEAASRRARMRLDNPPQSNQFPILHAPVSGIITERNVNPGMQIHPGLSKPLFVISDPTHLWITVELTESDPGKLRTGQSVAVSVEAHPGQIFMTKVENIIEITDSTPRRTRARVILDNPEGHLRPEMLARVTPLDDSGQPVLMVPTSALITEGKRTFVFVETAPGELHKRTVQLGSRTRDFSVVESGLHAGDRVAMNGRFNLATTSRP
ncbi:MAG: efflux RND transporter periplasmic adaptor subunit [Gammaproteobacteria bacterium]|nr:efflux RND transporter periplasmic adaptor subunit [Gammaproteobacteria bacterium]